MISTEILAKAKRQGRRIVEVGVHHYPRLHGNPSGASPLVILRVFYELAKLYRRFRERLRVACTPCWPRKLPH